MPSARAAFFMANAGNLDAVLIRKVLEKNPILKDEKNAIRIFDEYRDLGLIPKKYKVKEHFLNAITKLAKEDGITAKKAADKIMQLNAFSNRKNLGPQVIDFIKNKVRYEGIPLELDSSGKARFATRRFHEKPPKQLQAYIQKLESTGVLPKGYFEGFSKWARQGWEEAGNKNKKLLEKTGIQFDRGHLNESKSGGPNVKTNQRTEKALGPGGNRSKGATPNFKTPDIPNELGIPETWTRAFYEYDLDRQGLSATGLPKGKSLTDADIARIELGANPDQVVANRKAKLNINGNGTNGTNGALPDSHKKIVEKLQSGAGYTQDVVPPKPTNQQILGIAKNGKNGKNGVNGTKALTSGVAASLAKNKKLAKPLSLLTAGSLAGLGIFGTAASAADTNQRWKTARQNGNPLDYIQSGLSGISTGTGWSVAGEIVSTPADLVNLYIDALRHKRNGQMSKEERKQAVERLKFIK